MLSYGSKSLGPTLIRYRTAEWPAAAGVDKSSSAARSPALAYRLHLPLSYAQRRRCLPHGNFSRMQPAHHHWPVPFFRAHYKGHVLLASPPSVSPSQADIIVLR